MKILFTGGGTGGHLFPVLAIIREIKNTSYLLEKKGDSLRFYFVGPKNKQSFQLLKDEGVIVKAILAGKIRKCFGLKNILQNIVDILFKIPISFLQAFLCLQRIKPDIIFSKGGYGALPINWAVQSFKIPIFLHESDIILGRATKVSVKSAVKVFTSFDATETDFLPAEKTYCTGNPIRKKILNGNRKKGIDIFKLTDKKPIILILGGSQGAERINNLILTMLPDLIKSFEVIHQCGEKHIDEIRSTAQIIIKEKELFRDYYPVGFLNEEDLGHAFQTSHLVISRAGSGAIFEIAAAGKPSILLPLPEATQDHQAKNANAYAKNGAAVIMESKNPTPALLYAKIMSVFSQSEKLGRMSQSAFAFAKPDAAKAIVEHLVDALGASPPTA